VDDVSRDGKMIFKQSAPLSAIDEYLSGIMEDDLINDNSDLGRIKKAKKKTKFGQFIKKIGQNVKNAVNETVQEKTGIKIFNDAVSTKVNSNKKKPLKRKSTPTNKVNNASVFEKESSSDDANKKDNSWIPWVAGIGIGAVLLGVMFRGNHK